MENIKISVVVPCYNGEKYLEKNVESILNQTRKPFEIIIVDDGSKDGSFEKMKELAGKNASLKVHKNQKNIGLSGTRNVGFDISRGDIILYVDVDTTLEKYLLEKIENEYRRDRDKKIGAVGGQGIESNTKTVWDRYRKMHLEQSFGNVRKEVNYFFGLCSSFRREALKKAGKFDTFFRTNGEDSDIAMRVRNAGYKVIYDGNLRVFHNKQDTFRSLIRMIYNANYYGRLSKYKNRHARFLVKDKNYFFNGASIFLKDISKDISELNPLFFFVTLVSNVTKATSLVNFYRRRKKIFK